MDSMGQEEGLPDRLPLNQEARFPLLPVVGYRVTSKKTASHNCVAFAAGDETQVWDPLIPPLPGYYWPPTARRGIDIDALIECFETINYRTCDNGLPEVGYEKIALYVDSLKCWQHAARQLDDGTWMSKLGYSFDIHHPTPDALNGPEYGQVCCFMKRRKREAA